MRTLSSAFTGGAMTLARCWKLTRRDGVIFGFTDHDDDLIRDGVIYAARSGLSAADLTSATGFEVTGGDVSGALTSAGITEADIASGAFDGATIDVLLLDWTSDTTEIVLERAFIGEIRRKGSEFTCELRGLSSLYQEEKGRFYQRQCSADLGDARCGVKLDHAGFQFLGPITATDGGSYFECAADPAVYDFNNGTVEFMSGANQGQILEIKTHVPLPSHSGLWLWHYAKSPLVKGDAIRVTIGCDKTFATCRTRFANSRNFRGFPHIPGTDFVLMTVKDGTAAMDGGSLFR